MSNSRDKAKVITEKLQKVFQLMGSEADGEALSALRMAQKLIADGGMSWTEFVQNIFSQPSAATARATTASSSSTSPFGYSSMTEDEFVREFQQAARSYRRQTSEDKFRARQAHEQARRQFNEAGKEEVKRARSESEKVLKELQLKDLLRQAAELNRKLKAAGVL